MKVRVRKKRVRDEIMIVRVGVKMKVAWMK